MSILAGDRDTICALSTPEGHGGLAVVRLSGIDAIIIAKKVCGFLPDLLESHRVYYGMIRALRDKSEIDEVLVSYFKKGRSFTGEDTIEISCHGSSYLSYSIVQELVLAGARVAGRGEFTYRAFMNGRIDLVQAEGVLGLIQSQSKLSNRAALNHLRGSLSKEYKEIENLIMSVVCQLEADIDFTHENLSVENYDVLQKKLRECLDKLNKLKSSYNSGKQMREGCRVLILGSPNVGKSSLMNFISGEEKSIVTEFAGTTRDLVEHRTSLYGVDACFVDSAGIRGSEDLIEKVGIAKAKAAAKECDYQIWVIDMTQNVGEQIEILKETDFGSKILVIGNKIDLLVDIGMESLLHELTKERLNKSNVFEVVFCSIKAGLNLNELREKISLMLAENKDVQGAVVTQARHADLLERSAKSVEDGIKCLELGVSPEFAVFELKLAVKSIHDLLGIGVDDRVLDRIFEEFCIGK